MDKIIKENINFKTFSSISITDEETPEVFPPHWHNACEFTVALKDDCNFLVNDTLYKLSKGDILLIWPQQIHETVKVPVNGTIFTQFGSNILENNLDLMAISKFLYECNYISNKENPDLTSFISSNIYEIKKYLESSDILSETKCKLCIYNILIKISDYAMTKIGNYADLSALKGSGFSYIHEACSYIIDNSTENITQTDVARHIGLSTFYFSKLFKQYLHTTFPAYLSNIRVKNAANLLLDNNISITDVAFRSGFGSTTSFNKAFHDITGYAPREYRKMYRR